MDKAAMDNAYKDLIKLINGGASDDTIINIMKTRHGIDDVNAFIKQYKQTSEEGPEDDTVDNESPINDVEDNSDIPDWDAIAKSDAKEAGEKYQEATAPDIGQDIRNKLLIGARDASKIKDLLPKIINSIKLGATQLDSKIAHDALGMLINSKGLNLPEGAMSKMIDAYNKGLGIADLPAELSSNLYTKIGGTVLSGLLTDVLMAIDVGNANKKGLNKTNWWSGIFDAVDSATETLPVLGWIDLAGDAAGLLAGNDENGENYYRGGLLTKLSNMAEKGIYNATDGKYGDNTARTFWENDLKQQEKDKDAREWMKNRGYKGGTWGITNFVGNSGLTGLRTKKGSKAETEKKNDKAIDKIQGNTKGRGLAVKNDKDTYYVDKEQKDKGDALQYISYHNRANGKGIDSKGAYTFSDFTKDFKQDENGTWINKKTKQPVGEMMKAEKKKAYEREGGKGYKKEGETINI